VSADELLASAPPQDPRIRGKPRKCDGMTMWPLTHRGPAAGLHAYKIHISARQRRPPDELPVHEGHDWLYVLDGRLRLLLLGDESFVIETGRGGRVHDVDAALVRRSRRPVELIMIVGPQGERLHLHP